MMEKLVRWLSEAIPPPVRITSPDERRELDQTERRLAARERLLREMDQQLRVMRRDTSDADC
jgi:hypothetical protein